MENTKNRYRGIVCDRCGVEVTEEGERERVGHINLVVPLAIYGISELYQIRLVILGLPSKKWIRSSIMKDM